MRGLGSFPFGQPVLPVRQVDCKPKRVFVLGVYASAVHARWVGPDGESRIAAVGVASEPEIFWRGNDVVTILGQISVPPEAGHLVPAGASLNGPSGRALDDHFLAPLGISRGDAWLCDLVPHSCMNAGQKAAIQKWYTPFVERSLLPKPDWSEVPKELASESRRSAIVGEVLESQASVLITLGDQPLHWFAKHFGSRSRLVSYGMTETEYGHLHPLEIEGHRLSLLPLVHPRQAARLGAHLSAWAAAHKQWVKETAPHLLP